ncbi:MAG: hypothetical protein KBT35_01870 [Firmicutes bacterium]|nr:hypothetical protein [Candidatus Colivicinus equi]
MLSIRLSENEEKMLKMVANFEGVSVSQFVRNALDQKIDDLYDVKIGQEGLEKYQNGETKTFTYDEVFVNE